MGLKTLVKVGEVNNLSDARYCAGMGVEMIGFPLDGQAPGALSPDKALEIINWVSGVLLVGEFENSLPDEINEISKNLNLNYVQLPDNYNNNLNQISTPIILKTSLSEISALTEILKKYKEQVTYFLVESNKKLNPYSQDLILLCEKYPVILGFDISKENLPLILDTIKPSGINLKGGVELKPGLKDFEGLAEILEELEEID